MKHFKDRDIGKCLCCSPVCYLLCLVVFFPQILLIHIYAVKTFWLHRGSRWTFAGCCKMTISTWKSPCRQSDMDAMNCFKMWIWEDSVIGEQFTQVLKHHMIPSRHLFQESSKNHIVHELQQHCPKSKTVRVLNWPACRSATGNIYSIIKSKKCFTLTSEKTHYAQNVQLTSAHGSPKVRFDHEQTFKECLNEVMQ